MIRLLCHLPNAIAKALCAPWMLGELIATKPRPLCYAVEAVILRPVLVVCTVALLDTILQFSQVLGNMLVAVAVSCQGMAADMTARPTDPHAYLTKEI
jgi:hypothetical protein